MNMKKLAQLSLVPVFVMLVCMWLRPLWRDELWALYFSDPNLSMDALIAREMHDVHPPFYFWLLHFWRMISGSVMWMKLLNLVFLGAGIFAALRIGQGRRAKLTRLFLILCAGSYWVIYFAAEIRPYTLLFVCSALSVVTIHAALEDRPSPALFASWLIAGFVLGLSQYFGALWIGLLGGLGALWFFKTKAYKTGLIWGALTGLALVPVVIWIALSLGQMNISPYTAGIWDNTAYGLNQFRRAALDKTFGSNLGFTWLAVMGLPILWRRREPIDWLLAAALLLFVLIIFALHMFAAPMIKERGFIVMVPAVLYVMSRAILAGDEDGPPRPTAWRAAFMLIVIMPFVFISEYIKDREKMDAARAFIAAYPNCAGMAVPTYYRPSPQGDDFAGLFTDWLLRPLGDSAPAPVDVTTLSAPPPRGQCQITGMAFGLPRGSGKSDHKAALEAFARIGVSEDENQLYRLAGGRHLIFIDETAPDRSLD